MKRLRHVAGLVGVLGGAVIIFSILPLGTAFEFAPDEGFEVIKPFMCLKGYRLYTEIWNDQPPVLTKVLEGAFRMGGPTILSARLVAASYGLLLLGAFYGLLRMRSGERTALLATFLLVASPGVLMLCASVMLEVPAFATALLAALLVFVWGGGRHWSWLVASGAVMAVALQTKLTAVLVLPAIGIEIWMAAKGEGRRQKGERRQKTGEGRQETAGAAPGKGEVSVESGKDQSLLTSSPTMEVLRAGVIFGAGLAVAFAVIGMTWGKGALASSWRSHTGSEFVPGMDRPEDHTFEWRLLRVHVECVVAAAVCLVLASRQRRLRELIFPLVLLATVIGIHAVHRPWWNYYYLHLAIPLAWLAGWALSETVGAALRWGSRERGGDGSSPRKSASGKSARGRAVPAPFLNRPLVKPLLLCAISALVVARSERRLEGGIRDLRHRQTVAENPIVRQMRAHAGQVEWVYSESGIYPFHARLAVRPDLAIIMPKRFWSGQITNERILEACRTGGPGMIVLPLRSALAGLEPLASSYELVSSDAESTLYVPRGAVSARQR